MGLKYEVFKEIYQFSTFQALSNASEFYIDHLSMEEIVICEDTVNRYVRAQQLKETDRPALYDMRLNAIKKNNLDLYRIIKEKE